MNKNLSDYQHIEHIVRDFEKLTEEDLLKIIGSYSPGLLRQDMADFALEAIKLKLQKKLHEEMLEKQKHLVWATWILALAAIATLAFAA